jgi:hypothetical protein
VKERVYHLYFFHFFLAPETLYHISLRSFGEFGESERASISVSTTGKNNFLLESLLLNSSKLLNEIWYKVSGAEIIKKLLILSFGKFSKLFNEVQL